MADQKVSDLPSLNGVDVDPADLLYIVDSSAGTAGSKKITIGQFQLSPWSAATVNGVVYFDGSKVPASSSALTFDGTNLVSSGNIGLGVTPSAWSATERALDVGSTVALARGGSAELRLMQNSFVNASNQYAYKLSAAASNYEQTAGAHRWYTAPSGTAGNAISFTQAMTLDASGNLGIGTATPSTKLSVLGGASGTDTRATIGNSTSALQVGVDSSNNGVIATNIANQLGLYTNNTLRTSIESNGDIKFRTTSSSIVTHEFLKNEDGAEIRLYDAAGNIGALIDTAQTPFTFSRFLHASTTGDCHLGMGALCTGSIVFMRAGNVEAARVDPSGNFLIGTNSNVNNYKTHIFTSDTAAAVGIFQNNPTTPYGMNIYYGSAAPNNSNANTSFLYCNDISTVRIQLASNGGVINYQANNSNLSDRREKKDFAPAKSYLDTICAIPVQTFKYIDQTDDAPNLGVVAQDVQAVAPELVMESNWGTEDEPKMRLSIYQTDLQYALMKSIQELKTALDAANARIAALEAK